MSKQTHSVTFFCPGSFMDEQQTHPIASWDSRRAIAMAETVVERYGAKPYAFRFQTQNANGEETAESGLHFIDGVVLTRDDVDPVKNPVMHSNMGNEGWEVVCRTQRSYLHHGVFRPGDCTVDARGDVVERGDSPRLMAYRAKVEAERAATNAMWERRIAEDRRQRAAGRVK